MTDTAALARNFRLTALPDDFFGDPYRYYAALRTHSPFHRTSPTSIFLTRYDDVVAVYRSPNASADKKVDFAPTLGIGSPLYEHHTTSLVFSDPPLHTRVRRIIMGALNQRAIARMEAGVVSLVDRLLDELAAKRDVDLVEDFAAAIPVEVIGNLLDVPRGERGPLREWSLAILSALEPAPAQAVLDRGNAAVREFIDYLARLVGHRRSHPGDPEIDVLTRLIEGEQDGERLSETELFHNCIFLLNAGHETTTNLIGNGLHLLLAHPAEKARLVADPGLIGTAVEEFLRYEAPVQINQRRMTADTDINGTTIPAGTFVTLGVGAANRDPAQFPEPDRLDIGRRPNRHVAFGQGDHACSGMNVARMEGRIAIGRLTARFPGIEPTGTPERDKRIRFRGFRKVPARVA